ncbi:MAG: alpha/beta hydrolase [Deltaproteobacteria bacterium]|nr:alpha/beta hydrolase [Deltaproteobacteria bacterium]
MTAPTTRKIHLATGLDYNVYEWSGPAASETTYVLVHGFTDFGFGWCEVAPLLAERGHVLAPDLRGHGDSEWIGRGGYYHFLDYVADLDDVIRQLARPRVTLVGHSMGGSVSGYYAGVRPERLTALALLEGLGPPDMAGTDGPTRTVAWIDAWRGARDKVRPMPSLDEAVRRLRKNDELLGEDLARRIAAAGTREVFGGLVWKHDPLHTTFGPYPFRVDSARRYWERVTCPTLIVDGAQSRLNLHEAERAARRACFPNARHLVLDQAGHALQRHQPAKLAAAIFSLGA